MPYKNTEERRAVSRESHRRRRAAAGSKRQPRRPPLPELAELRYRTMTDLLDVLGREIDTVLGAELPVDQRARLIAYLVSVAARLVEGADTERRLADIEAALERIGVSHGKATKQYPATA